MSTTGRTPRQSRAQDLLDAVRPWFEPLLLGLTLVALASGVVAWLAGNSGLADTCWVVGTIAGLVPACAWVLIALAHQRAGVDLIAVLALVGTLVVGEYVAGALIAVMMATGRTLDAAAERRATHDLRALLERAPRTARRRVGAEVSEVPLKEVLVGDLLMVGPGEVVPVDGAIEGTQAVFDESALTGEPDPVERAIGDQVRSGVLNAGGAFELRAGATAANSTYAGIIALVRQAGADSAPVIRLADRYATWFLPLSIAIAGLAWLTSGSLVRAVAVLVVATPCPLLLAAPVAIVSGLSRASRIGVVIRSGVALESLGRARTMVIDKTGTLTAGHPAVIEIAAAPGWEAKEVLRLAASADQLSPHVLAEAIVAEATARQLLLTLPTEVSELAGRGVAGTIENLRVEVGKQILGPDAPAWAQAVLSRATLDNSTVTWLTVEGALVGAALLRDPLRPDANRTVRRLRSAGLRRLVMLTGDRAEPAQEIGTALGLDEVRAEQTPASKLAAVRLESELAVTIMVGDGINDAPALAAATVGVAMGARGATASSEAADIILTTDRLDRLADAMDIARRARQIAVQSAVAGMAMSLLAMVAAALGFLPPAAGALLQEGIDVAVILNALRALTGGRSRGVTITPETERLLHNFAVEHDQLRDAIASLRSAASLLAAGINPEALNALRCTHMMLVQRILPHERAEEAELYPALAAPLGSPDATAPMSRVHAEIERLTRRLGTHLAQIDASGRLDPGRVEDLLACLYGLHAVLTLHFTQEEENYFVLASTNPAGQA
jgi:heavy metal translocating P-type ATPase